MSIRVLIADDQELYRVGLLAILRAAGDVHVVAEAEDGLQAAALARRTAVDVALLDIRMPRLDGIEAARRILDQPDPPRVVMLTTFESEDLIVDALRAGASGYLLKDVAPAEIVDAVRTVAAGEAILSPAATGRLIRRILDGAPVAADPTLLDPLTPREREVFAGLADGLSNSEIADRLRIAEQTVRDHVSIVLAKLQLRDRAQAIVLAYEAGVVTPTGRRPRRP